MILNFRIVNFSATSQCCYNFAVDVKSLVIVLCDSTQRPCRAPNSRTIAATNLSHQIGTVLEFINIVFLELNALSMNVVYLNCITLWQLLRIIHRLF